jgi:threonine/homoserine/homoserine lactone efflux protein
LAVYLILGITFGFAAAVQPGPLQTFLISRTLDHGWRQTLPAAGAPLVSDIPVVILVLLILSNLPLWVENILHFAGGFFVLFLAWGALKSFRNYGTQPAVPLKSARRNFIDAVLVNLLNPNPYLAWSLVMGPLFWQGWREAPSHGIGLMAGFYGAIILTTAGIILLFATFRRFGPRVSRILLGISAVALAGFGVYQLYLGAAALWPK